MELQEFEEAIAMGKELVVYSETGAGFKKISYETKQIARATLTIDIPNTIAGGFSHQEIISKLIDVEKREVLYDFEKDGILVAGCVKPLPKMLDEDLLIKLEKIQDVHMKVKDSNTVLLIINNINNIVYVIPRHFPGQISRKWKDDNILIISLGNGEQVEIKVTDSIEKEEKGIRYSAIIAPNYTERELKEKIEENGLTPMAEYLFVKC